VSDNWDYEDTQVLWPWLLRGVYQMKGGVIGRTVQMPKVFEFIKTQNYWGNEKELEKYYRFTAGEDFKRNVYRITRWMIDKELLRPHASFVEVSITRQGINMINKCFPELE
jgi:hypothetical protein